MGAFVNRLLGELEKAHGVKIPVKSWEADGVEDLVKKAKGGQLSGSLNEVERTNLSGLTTDIIKGLPKGADGKTPSTIALRNLQKAYSHSVLTEFGEGPAAEAASRAFRDSISDSLKTIRTETPRPELPKDSPIVRSNGNARDPAVVALNVERVEVRVAADMKNPDVRVKAATARATEQAEARQAQVAQRAQGTSGPVGPQSNQTEAEKAATARVAAERTNTLVDATYGARTNITKGLRGIDQGGFAEKKAAFDLIDQGMEGSGYVQRPANAAEAAHLAAQPSTRSVEDIKKLLLTRPGEGADGKFINGSILPADWTKLRSSLRADLLTAERQDIAARLDKARLAGGNIDNPAETFTRLRDIMRDPDYLARHQLQTPAAAPTSVRGQTPVRQVENVEKDLADGKVLTETDVNMLAVRYGRPDKAAIDALALKAVSKDSRTFLKREEVDELRTKLSQSGLLTASPDTTKGLDKANFAQHLKDGKPITEGDFDSLVASQQNKKRPWTVNMPFGDKMGLNGVEVPKWVRNGIIGTGLGYFGLINVPGSGDAVDGGFVGAAYKGVGVLTGGKTLIMPEGSILDAGARSQIAEKNAEAEAKERDLKQKKVADNHTGSVQSIGQGVALGMKTAATGAPAATVGLSVVEADAVVGELNTKYSLIDLKQMTDLAQVIADKSKVSSPETLSASEYAEVKQDAAYKGLPKTAQQKLDEILTPKLAP